MPKHSRKRRRSKSRSRSRDDEWLRKRLAEMQMQLDQIQAEKSSDSGKKQRRERSHSVATYSGNYDEISSRPSIQGDEEIDSPDRVSNIEQCNSDPEIRENADHNAVEPTVEPVEQDLGEDLLEILGSEPAQKSPYGPPVHKAIMPRWTDVLKSGLSDITKQDIIKKYLVPENLPILKPPKLNPEVVAAISAQVSRRDDRLLQKQNQLAASISAIGETISLMLGKERGGDRRYIELLSDAGRLLCDFHHTETLTRRDLIGININKSLRDTLSDAPIDEFLFGETLEDRIKAAKNLEKSSQELKPIKPKIFKKPIGLLNIQGPSRPMKGARVGLQYERAPYQRPNNLQRFGHRDPQINRSKRFRKPPREVSRTKMERQRRYH